MGSTTEPSITTPPFYTIPYWNMNLPSNQHTATCPPFLANVNRKDFGILITPNDDYPLMSWDLVRALIDANRIDMFQRVPSELRRYMAYTWATKEKYGSVMNFVLNEKLGWGKNFQAADPEHPFKDESDYLIKWNDWPYGLDARIVHLCVWTKFPLPNDETGFRVTEEAASAINGFVEERFVKKLGAENVRWFKNWDVLKSIKVVEHFHVMLSNPDPSFIKEITRGEIPYFKRIEVVEDVHIS